MMVNFLMICCVFMILASSKNDSVIKCKVYMNNSFPFTDFQLGGNTFRFMFDTYMGYSSVPLPNC